MYTQDTDRPAHCVYGPSSLERRFLCPGSAALEANLPDQSSTDAQSGTRIHKWLQGAIDFFCHRGENPSVEGMTAEEQEIGKSGFTYFLNEMRDNDWREEMVQAEAPLEYKDGFGVLYWGTADVLVVDHDAEMITVIDWKTGFIDVAEAQDNWQGAAYALAAMSWYPGYSCRVVFHNPRSGEHSEHVYENEDFRHLKSAVCKCIADAKRPDAPRVFGERQCRYCKAAAQCVCPEFNASRMAVAAMGNESMKVSDMSDNLLAEYYQRCKLVARASEMIEAEMRKRIEEKGEVAGYRIKKVSGGFDCDDLPSLYTALGDVIEQKDFLECCKVSVTNLRDLWARKAKDCGVCKSIKAAKDEFMLNVANLLVERSPRIWITKDKEKE